MKFEEATKKVKTLNSKPTNDELLKLYSLYKQSTDGDCDIPQPYIYQLEAKAKWSAWSEIRGMDGKEAQKKYVHLVEKLIDKYGIN